MNRIVHKPISFIFKDELHKPFFNIKYLLFKEKTRESVLKTGNRFKFEKIIVSAGKIQKPKTTSGSGKLRTMRTVCERDGLTFVNKTWKPLGKKNNE